MKPNADLFTLNGSVASTKIETRWLFVSNHLNLMYMMAAGLVMPPKGFGNKYYQDTLAAYPGWIPLFANDVPKDAIAYSVSERNHLIPCIATMNLTSLKGKVMAIDSNGLAKEINFPEELDGSEHILLVPAPLPIHWITSVAFQSKERKSACEADARDFGNVPLQSFVRDINANLFSKGSESPWPDTDIVVKSKDVVLDVPFAAGGIMAMLLHYGNLGDVGMQASRLAFDSENDVTESISDPIISSLGKWMQSANHINSDDISTSLFWGAVLKLAECRFADPPSNPREVLLSYLLSTADGMESRMKHALIKLAEDLRAISVFSDKTITEIFERHPKSFSRVMTLLFLRDNCEDLLAFKHSLLTETDTIAAAILFAARDGWLGLPIKLRNFSDSYASVQHRMASMAHRLGNTNIELGPPPARPKPLRELFFPSKKGWSTVQASAALNLAREYKWSCIQTRIILGKGEYIMAIDGAGLHLIIPGEAKVVKTEVDVVKFLDDLASTEISDKESLKVRNQLKAVEV